jgi:hypothetical protein
MQPGAYFGCDADGMRFTRASIRSKLGASHSIAHPCEDGSCGCTSSHPRHWHSLHRYGRRSVKRLRSRSVHDTHRDRRILALAQLGHLDSVCMGLSKS